MSSAPSSSHEIDTSKDNIYSTSILIANLPSPANYHGLESAIRNATRSTNDRLVIILYSPGFASQEDSRANWFEVQKILTWTYVESTAMAQEMDKVLLDTDVLLRTQYKLAAEGSTEDEELVKRVDALYVFESDADTFSWWTSRSSNTMFVSNPASWSSSQVPLSPEADKVKPCLPVVALGGTFDHLHAGHKILLSMAAWISQRKLIVGVTVDNLLVKKANKHILESFAYRSDRVRSFLTSFKPNLEYDIVPLRDVCGPTAVDPDIQGLVISKETLSGGAEIGRKRKELGFPPLEIFVIDVISAKDAALDSDDPELLKKTKMSSTFIREWIASKQRHEGTQGEEQSRPA